MSETLAARYWEPVSSRLKDASLGNAGSRYDVAALPSDAKAYSGFQFLYMTD